MDAQTFLAFIAYFLILLSIGILSYRKQRSDSDFIVGNRSLNFWVIALSAHASDMSSWLFMGFPAAIMIRGLPQWWIAVGLLMGMYLNWQLVATKLRRYTEKLNSYTLSTFFERRFNDTSGIIRTITALAAVIFLSCYISAGLIGMGLLFESVFNIDYYLGLTIAMFVVVVYTYFGGFITVAWTDLFQALFLLSMIILVPWIAYLSLDNDYESITTIAQSKQIDLSIFEDFSWQSIFTIVLLVFGWGLGYFGQPHIITKFMGIKDPAELKKSKYLGMTWMLITLLGAIAVGLVGIGYFTEELAKPELVFVQMVKSLFHPLAAGFILCGVLAASMSTMDSQILVCASVLSEDLYKHIIRKESSPAQLLRVSRIGVIVVSLTSLLIAFKKNSTVLDTVQYAWSGLGCAFGPLVLTSLYWKGANKYGAMAGIVVGGIVAGTWDMINFHVTRYAIPAMIPGFVLSLLSIYGVSYLTRSFQAGQQNEFVPHE
jgi:sodium/proline symporter